MKREMLREKSGDLVVDREPLSLHLASSTAKVSNLLEAKEGAGEEA